MKDHSEMSLQQTTTLLAQLPELGMNGAVIAATSLAHGLQLVTVNVVDFQRVTDLVKQAV